VKHQNSKGDKTQAFVVEHRPPGDPDKRAENRESNRTQAEDASAARDERTGWAEKINVRQFLDLERFKSEASSENWLVVTRRHKAVATTRFRGGRKPQGAPMAIAVLTGRRFQTAAP